MRVKGSLFLLFAFFMIPAFVAWGEDLVQEIAFQEKKLEELKREQSRVEQELNKALKNEKNLLAEIEKLETQIERLENDINRSRQRILALEKERTSLQKEVEVLTDNIARNKFQMKALLVGVYRRNFGMSFWEYLVESASPSEWEERWYLLRKYQEFEIQTIVSHVSEREALNAKVEEIKRNLRLESALKEKLVLENERVAKLKEARQKMREKVNADKEKFKAMRQKLSQAQKEVEDIIVALQKKLQTKQEGPRISSAKKGKLLWPVQGGKVIRNFGESKDPRYGVNFYNPGIDIAAPLGSPVVAASSGVVILAQNVRGYGKTIILDHGQDIVTVYAHLAEFKVMGGQTVQEGQVIGLVGDSGLTDGPVLHFEVRTGKKAKEENPLYWLE